MTMIRIQHLLAMRAYMNDAYLVLNIKMVSIMKILVLKLLLGLVVIPLSWIDLYRHGSFTVTVSDDGLAC